MYSSLNKDGSPLQLIEKAQTFSEDDDLLSPFDTGDVERQMKRAWWKTCSLFTFLLATLGIIMFIIIRDSNGNENDNSNDSNNKIEASKMTHSSQTQTQMQTQTQTQTISQSKSLSQRGELPSSIATNTIGERTVFHKLYDPQCSQCVDSMLNTFVEHSEITDDSVTLNNIENGFFYILDEFGGSSMKYESKIKEYVTKSSELGYYSNQLNIDFEINSLTVTAKSDALIFLLSMNWESQFGNKLPYTTEKILTMQYDYKECEVTSLMPISFTECFNGKCDETLEKESHVVSYLKGLVTEKIEDKL